VTKYCLYEVQADYQASYLIEKRKVIKKQTMKEKYLTLKNIRDY
jgi:hypothetical protein